MCPAQPAKWPGIAHRCLIGARWSTKSILHISIDRQDNRNHLPGGVTVSSFGGQGLGTEPKSGLAICEAEEETSPLRGTANSLPGPTECMCLPPQRKCRRCVLLEPTHLRSWLQTLTITVCIHHSSWMRCMHPCTQMLVLKAKGDRSGNSGIQLDRATGLLFQKYMFWQIAFEGQRAGCQIGINIRTK